MSLSKGLPNLGNTCYINSILQCLRFTRPLVYSLKKFTDEVTPFIDSLIDLLFAGAPVNVLHQFIRSLARTPEFKLMRQCDAHELYLYLIDNLYEKLNKPNPFKGKLKSTITCTDCQHKSETYTPFISLSVQIPDHQYLATGVTIQELLDEFCDWEVLEDYIDCENCKVKKQSTKGITIETPPVVLVVHLKRFQGIEKIHTPVDLTNNVLIGDVEYQLYATCNHSGGPMGGHYTACCKKRDSSWVVCNDMNVNPISVIPDSSDRPYVLFFNKVYKE